MKEHAWYVDTKELSEMVFARAAEVWLASRTPYISAKTFHEYQLNIRTLQKFFGEMRLREITADQIRAYQAMRTSQQCGPSGVNHECSVLQQMLKRIGKWPEIGPQYQALPLPNNGPGRVLSPEERTRLFKVSAREQNWEGAFLFAVLSINTSAGPKEMATLRLKDVDLEEKLINVQPEGAKNAERVRSIPLNEEAFKAAQLAAERARRLGAVLPDHYLFPFRISGNYIAGKYDPTRHQTTFKGAWLKMVAAAELPGLRMYDLRHHCITVMLEDPHTSEETVQAIAGHVSRRMMKRYSHIRMASKRAAVCGFISSGMTDFGIEPRTLLPENAVTNETVVDMFRAEIPKEIIAAKIRTAAAYSFDVSVGTIKLLRTSGLPDEIILAMVRRGEKGNL